jgi:hypothetical protein
MGRRDGLTTMGSDIKIGDGLKKTFNTVMGTWHEDSSKIQRLERRRMMKRHGDSKVGNHLIGDVVDIV